MLSNNIGAHSPGKWCYQLKQQESFVSHSLFIKCRVTIKKGPGAYGVRYFIQDQQNCHCGQQHEGKKCKLEKITALHRKTPKVITEVYLAAYAGSLFLRY